MKRVQVCRVHFVVYIQVNSETKQRYTYADIIQLTEALAAGMRIKWNVSPGDRVMILLPVCMEYPIATMAVHLCGATGVLANPLHTVGKKILSCGIISWKGAKSLSAELCSRAQARHRPD